MNKGLFILLLILLYLVSPLCCLIVCVRFYRSAISQLFMVLCAFYFGYYCGFVADLMKHYYNFMYYYPGHDVTDIITRPEIYFIGNDFYHVGFKLLLSRYTESRQVFGGAACAIYTALFICFMRQLWHYIEGKLPIVCMMLMICVIVVIEFYWYQGLRFYTGVFFFAAFYMRYVRTKKLYNLIVCLLCPVFHFSLMALSGALLLNIALNYGHFSIRYVLLALSLLVRSMNIDIVPFINTHLLNLGEMSIAYADMTIRSDVLEHMEMLRSTGNVVYMWRDLIMIGFGVLMSSLIYLRNKQLEHKFTALFYMFLTLFTIANFGYGDMTFYERFLKVSSLFLYAYLFLTITCNYAVFKKSFSLLLMLVVFPTVLGVITPLVSQRAYIFHSELFFGNMFMDWDGNEMEGFEYQW